ncbi:MAG: molecular chaperone TorD family protein [Hyphomicrobiaceae bacterium]|nr:molecular chaperone TorD family protein [Hyphomicrobiaceae bacterium]
MPPLPSSAISEHDQAFAAVAAEDLLRADVYRFLARLLSGPVGTEELTLGAGLEGDSSSFGQAIDGLAAICRETNPAEAAAEYQDLFIGLARGEILPYGSYYLTGFLHEKPLARLRRDMERLGIERDPEATEPEDHIASLLEMMAGLIDGSFGEPLALAEQKLFYEAHLGSWARVMFRDLEKAASARLYAKVGAVGRAFIEIENGAFRMV